MRALVLEQFGGPFVAKDVPTPTIAPHEALVRVRHVGVCGTDVKIRANRMGLGVIPLIMGHEIAGEVAAVGREVREFAPGDRVLPLARIEEAFDALRDGSPLGRNVLAV